MTPSGEANAETYPAGLALSLCKFKIPLARTKAPKNLPSFDDDGICDRLLCGRCGLPRPIICQAKPARAARDGDQIEPASSRPTGIHRSIELQCRFFESQQVPVYFLDMPLVTRRRILLQLDV